mgnify:CR=1 FL=1
MKSEKIDPKFNKFQNPKIGLVALASDYMIEKDFIKIIKDYGLPRLCENRPHHQTLKN